MVDPRFDIQLDEVRSRPRGIKWGRGGPDVLAAWVADMDFAIAEPIRNAVTEMWGRSDIGYSRRGDDLGPVLAARAAKLWGWELDPELVVPTADVLQGVWNNIYVHSERGDGVAMQTPIYHPFLTAIKDTERSLVDNPLLTTDDSWELDVDGLRTVIDGRTRIMLLCNPHNPSGRAFRRDELEALAEVVAEHDLIVISDEIHADLLFPGVTHTCFASLPGMGERTITLTSATKAFNLAGIRTAVAVFGTPALKETWDKTSSFLLGHVNTPGIEATITAWEDPGAQEWLDALMVQLEANRDRLVEFAGALPGVEIRTPDSTYLAWLDCRALPIESSPAGYFLEHAGLDFNDGAVFGTNGPGHVRLNFATGPSILEQILERFGNAVAALG
ncbi:MAG: aminotransferase class I/II-fold pyridoxal phosphate-dependent enzyme [Actinomycetia bacterium]|nr:aminotransferase class I/II-fold pyridoxal phosphate-dependent enzyme [Actinomycetes bacterium]